MGLLSISFNLSGSRALAQVPANLQADSLLRRAAVAFEGQDLDLRRRAIEELAMATRLVPTRPDVWLAHARACLERGESRLARHSFEQAAKVAPEDPATWHELATAWRLDWMYTAEAASLDKALACHGRAVQLDPARSDDWIATAMLLVMHGRAREAIAAGLRARAADPAGDGPWLALGAALFRSGATSLADSAFQKALSLCNSEVHARLAGTEAIDAAPGPIDSSRSMQDRRASKVGDTPPASWLADDPDLTTAENEAQLDYLTRVALALFLFQESGHTVWDRRAQLFVRYGPPTSVVFNSALAQLGWENNLEYRPPKRIEQRDAPGGMPIHYNLLTWQWEHLGMSAQLWDLYLRRRYDFPPSLEGPRDIRPDFAELQARPELLAVNGGIGVFRRMAPGLKPMRVVGQISRFPQSVRSRLIVQVFTAGTPADSMSGSCAVMAEDGQLLMRESRPLSISACAPTTEQVADFALNVPPGRYRVDVSVQDKRGRRGIMRMNSQVDRVQGLVVSDLVLLCQEARPAPDDRTFHVEPARTGIVGTTGALYYEIDGLELSPQGDARYEYAYAVHRSDRDDPMTPLGASVLSATREESSPTPYRRQVLNLPLRELQPGQYVLELTVRDLGSQARVVRRIAFRRADLL